MVSPIGLENMPQPRPSRSIHSIVVAHKGFRNRHSERYLLRLLDRESHRKLQRETGVFAKAVTSRRSLIVINLLGWIEAARTGP